MLINKLKFHVNLFNFAVNRKKTNVIFCIVYLDINCYNKINSVKVG